MKATLTLLPYVSIYPSKITVTQEAHWEPSKPGKYQELEEDETTKVKYEHLLSSKRKANGKLSDIAVRKMSKAIDYLLFVAAPKKVKERISGKIINFKVAFITLTLSSRQIHTDKEIRESLLNQFLIEVKKKYNVKNYVWRAEKQKNGNIHFHLLFDKFIHYSELRDMWNRIQNKLGYVDRYRDEMKDWHKEGFRLRQELTGKWEADKQYQAWLKAKKSDYNNPNSTDIHSLYRIKNVKKYITKYMSKDDIDLSQLSEAEREKLTVEGRLWGCNFELSNIKGAKLPVDNEISEMLCELNEDPKVHKIHDTYYSVFLIDANKLSVRGFDRLFDALKQYCSKQFSLPYNFELEISG
jgi:hypothetical protein